MPCRSFRRDRIFFERFFSWDVAIFSNSSELILAERIYRCYCRLLFVLFLLRGGICRASRLGVRFLRDFINLYNNSFGSHPSRCLREKCEKKDVRTDGRYVDRDFIVLTFCNFLFRAIKKIYVYQRIMNLHIHTYIHSLYSTIIYIYI